MVLLLGLACLGVLWGLLGVGPGQLDAPFFPSGDLYQVCRWYRGYLSHGNVYDTPELGAPFGAFHYGWPLPLGADLPFLFLFSLFTDNVYALYNGIYVCGLIGCALSAFWALRRFGVGRAGAVGAALLYAFLPNHLARYEHLMVSFQVATPGMIWLTWRLACGDRAGRAAWFWVVLASLSGIYSSYFGCWLLLLGGWIGSLKKRDKLPFLRAIGLCALLCFLSGALMLPALVGRSGEKIDIPFRRAEDIRQYSLPIERMVLPYDAQESHPLAALADRYQQNFPNSTGFRESAYLGLAALTGLAGLLLGLGRRRGEDDDPVPVLAALVVFLMLVCSAEGFAPLLTQLLGRGIRAYNRASYYIAFAGLVWVALAGPGYIRSSRLRWLLGVTLTGFGLWEQCRSLPAWSFAEGRRAAESSRDFVHQLEARLPAGSMIWQAPYIPYPETAQLYREGEYTWAQLYIPGPSLRWSWGDLKGSRRDDFREACSHLPWNQQVPLLGRSGFAGIVVLRPALHDFGRGLEADLQGRGLRRELVSSDGRFAFFPIPHPDPPSAETFANGVAHLNTDRSPLVFTRGAGGTTCLRAGWSVPEPHGVWSLGATAQLEIPDLLPRIHPARQQVELTLELTPFVAANGSQTLSLWDGEQELGGWTFTRQERRQLSVALWLPARLRFQVSRPAQSEQVPAGEQRALGVMLHRIDARRLPVFQP